MSGLNKVMLIGHLGKDPEVRATPGGKSVVNFSIATSEKWKGKDGKQQERTEWHKIVAWDKLADLCGEYLNKGRQVYIEGSLQTREWDKNGQKQYSTEVVASQVVFLGGDGAKKGRSKPAAEEGPPPPSDAKPEEDGIPF